MRRINLFSEFTENIVNLIVQCRPSVRQNDVRRHAVGRRAVRRRFVVASAFRWRQTSYFGLNVALVVVEVVEVKVGGVVPDAAVLGTLNVAFWRRSAGTNCLKLFLPYLTAGAINNCMILVCSSSQI